MITIKDRFIPREEISKLLWGMIGDISTHSLSMWIKSKTDDEVCGSTERILCLGSFIFGTTGSSKRSFTV